jgi:DNA-binding transcriptional ArsR family regulator
MKARRDIFQAIADPTRRAILEKLLQNPKTVGAIAEQFAVTRQAVSLHTRVLEECGAITIEKHGRERLCRIKPATLAQISDWLEPFVDLWGKRLDQLEDLLANPEEEQG